MHVPGQASISGSCYSRANAARTGEYQDPVFRWIRGILMDGILMAKGAKLLIVGKSDLQNRLKLLLFNEFFF